MDTHQPQRPERLLTPAEVAKIFRVDPKTVTRWAAVGVLVSIRTPGGHRRFPESAVLAYFKRQKQGDQGTSPTSN